MTIPDTNDSSSDGAARVTLFDVASAVKNLGKGCKRFLGGEEHLGQIASFAQGMRVVELISTDSDKKVPGLDQTYREYWDSSGLGNRPVARVIARSESGSYKTYPYIIVGPGYFIPAQINADMRDFFNRAYGSDIGKWQRDALVHEFMHIWTNKNDMDMAKLWKDQGADLGDISTREKASGEIALFMSRDCKKKK
jgi:hypothetical protein